MGIDMEEKMDLLFEQLVTAIRNGKAKQAKNLIEEMVDLRIPVEQIVNDGLIRAMEEINVTIRTDRPYIPEVILASRAMEVATVVLEDLLDTDDRACIGTVVAATVQGDLHEIGLNLVCMMMRNAGFRVYNLGCDVSAEEIVRRAEETEADIICLSAMLTTTMPRIQRTIRLLENKGLRDRFVVMVGGAPVTRKFAERIGADIYTSNAVEASRRAKALMEERQASGGRREDCT